MESQKFLIFFILQVLCKGAFSLFPSPSSTSTGVYRGSGVGPLWLFRSSQTNADKVNRELGSNPLLRNLALAFGDEFPALRDDVIRRLQQSQLDAKALGDTTARPQGIQGILSSPAVGALTNFYNYRIDPNQARNEIKDPYRRSGPGSGLLTRLLSGVGGTFSLFSGGRGSSSTRNEGLFSSPSSASESYTSNRGGGGPFPSFSVPIVETTARARETTTTAGSPDYEPVFIDESKFSDINRLEAILATTESSNNANNVIES